MAAQRDDLKKKKYITGIYQEIIKSYLLNLKTSPESGEKLHTDTEFMFA